MNTDRSVYYLGEHVDVWMDMCNPGSETVRVLSPATCLEAAYEVLIINADDEIVAQWNPSLVCGAAGTYFDFLPGQCRTSGILEWPQEAGNFPSSVVGDQMSAGEYRVRSTWVYEPDVFDSDPITILETPLDNASALLAPIGGAHTSGSFGSDWHDTQLFRDLSGNGVSGALYAVLRSDKWTENPGFDPYTSPGMAITVPAGGTLIIEDAYLQITGGDGAGALWFVPDGYSDEPLWRSMIYNEAGNARNGMTAVPLDPDTAYHAAGTTLTEVLSPSGYRDGIFLVAGPEGVSGYWKYKNAAGNLTDTIADSLGASKTKQYTGGAVELLGFAPEPGSQLDFVIEDGSAIALISRTNNASNDSALNEFGAMPTPVSASDSAVK